MFYEDYYWEEGVPRGRGKIDQEGAKKGAYKIVMDPYRKRISIEKYRLGRLDSVIYDSNLLDFRQLKRGELTAWQAEVLEENVDCMICLIRNQDDRVVFQETHHFEKGLCRKCLVHSPQGVLLSVHRMSYVALGDTLNGVTLYDAQEKPVMLKRYNVDPESGSFTELVEESWSNQLK